MIYFNIFFLVPPLQGWRVCFLIDWTAQGKSEVTFGGCSFNEMYHTAWINYLLCEATYHARIYSILSWFFFFLPLFFFFTLWFCGILMNYLQHFLLTAARIIKLCFLNISLSFSSTPSVVKVREEGKKNHCLISQDLLLFPLLLCSFASSAFFVTAFNLGKTFKFLHFSVS